MKRLILLLSIFTASLAVNAQTASKDHAIFRFNNPGEPKLITSLGADPEFPFLRNLSTPQQVVAAMKRAAKNPAYSRKVAELNELLMQSGFANGIKDVTASAVTPYEVTDGTTGNMGSGKLNYIYSKMGDSYKGWKVSSPTDDYIVFFSPCGNAFYPGAYQAPQAINPVSAVELPITPIQPIAVEESATYTGNKKEECDPCKPKDCCRVKEEDKCGCSPRYYGYRGYSPRMYRRAYYNSYYRD